MIAHVILAAGASQRMGRPKPLLPFGGCSLIERAIQEARAARVDPVLVVLGHDAEQILSEADLGGAQVIVNPNPDAGQTGSLQAAVRSLPAEAEAFVNLPVDFPGVGREEIDAVVAAWSRRDPSTATRIVTAAYHGRLGRPTLFARETFGAILALAADAPVRELVETETARIDVEIGHTRILRDMDTPRDYRHWLHELGLADRESGAEVDTEADRPKRPHRSGDAR
jgi:molybdenum cofactor cytidylyltransferase